MAYQNLYQRRRALASPLTFDSRPNGASWIDHQRSRNPELRVEALDANSFSPQEREEARRIQFQIDQGQLPFGTTIPHRLMGLVFPEGLPADMAASMRAHDDTTARLARSIVAASPSSRASTMSAKLTYLLAGDDAISEADLDSRLAHHGIRDVSERIALKISARDAGVLLRPGEPTRLRLRLRPSMQAAATKKGRKVPDIQATDSRGCCAYDRTKIEC